MPSSGRYRWLSEPRSTAAGALARWARRRQGPDRLPLVLKPRRIYIVPTRTGLAAAVLLFLMLLAGLNYNNSLALMLCFLLCGVLLVSMYQCHRTLAGLAITRAAAEPAFAGGEGELRLLLADAGGRERGGLALRCAPCAATPVSIGGGADTAVSLRYRAGARGRQRIDRIEVATLTPLGMFRAWSWLHLPLEALVYPAPLAGRALPPPRGTERTANRTRSAGTEEWAWLRPFRDGDSPRAVAWKAYARGAPLLAAHYDAQAGGRRLLDFSALQSLPLETRLSILTAWVLECERRAERYALRLPGIELSAACGPVQRHTALEALALFAP